MSGSIGVRRDPSGKTNKWEAALSIAGVGRVVLGLYDSREAAAIAHDDAKIVAAATLKLTAKSAERQRYNCPKRAYWRLQSGDIPETPAVLAKLAERRASVLSAELGIPAREAVAASHAAAVLQQRLDALEARVAALEHVATVQENAANA